MKQVDVRVNEKKVGYIAPGSHGKSALYIDGCVFETEGVFNTPVSGVVGHNDSGVIEMARVVNVPVRNTHTRWTAMVDLYLIYPRDGGALRRVDLPYATYRELAQGAQVGHPMQHPAPASMPNFSDFARDIFRPDQVRGMAYDADGVMTRRSFKRLESAGQFLGIDLVRIDGVPGDFGVLVVDRDRGMLIAMDQKLMTPVAAGHIESGILRVEAWYCEPFPAVSSPRVMTLKSKFDECEYAVVLTEDQPTGGNVRYAGAGRVLRINRPVTGKGVYKALVGLAEVPSTPGIPAVLEVSVNGDEIVATIVA